MIGDLGAGGGGGEAGLGGRRRAWRYHADRDAGSATRPFTRHFTLVGTRHGDASTGSPRACINPGGGMSGMPMVPPGAMQGAAGSEKDDKPDTKRVSVPTVKNGAPVQGRITAPPPSPPQVVKKVDGKPVATRRIIVPSSTPTEDDPSKS